MRKYAFQFAHDLGFSKLEAYNIQVAFTEALNNVIQHAYKRCYEMPILVEFHKYSNRIEIHIRDYGIRTPRSEIKSRPLDEFREGGLGVYLMEEFMDYLNYDTSYSKGTKLIMTKHLQNKE